MSFAASAIFRHGRPLGFYVPWKDTENLPLELKREAFIKNAPLRKKLFGHIDEKDLMIFEITDSADRAVEIIKNAPVSEWWSKIS